MERIPKHEILYIAHNDFKSLYQDIKEYIYEENCMQIYKEMTKEEIEKCIKNNEIWELRWYPISPVSFYTIFAPTLEECLNKINSNTSETPEIT